MRISIARRRGAGGWPGRPVGLAAALIAACTSADRPASGPAEFVLADEPTVSVGIIEGAEPYLLNGVTDALLQSSGDVVIANCGSGELRFFDERGQFLRSVGRDGSGPGEFRYLKRMFSAGGDSIATYDALLRRLLFSRQMEA